jgi:cellulose synthase/poly-beta-1,6-N-acetylglucosamine synthase-like glycosyltransferase
LLVVLLGLAVFVICLASAALTTLVWTLYAWRNPAAMDATRFGQPVVDPTLSFSLIVPARHETAVLAGTLTGLLRIDHPSVEILVVVGHDDPGTAEVAAAIAEQHPERVRLVIDRSWPKNKPRALNSALPHCRGQVVGVFDAEDDVHPQLLRHVEACFRRAQADVVQAGVQLMNFRSNWYSLCNVLEYLFWFKSRLHYQAKRGFIPLAGNTVFVRRDLLCQEGGWDPDCLAEDCELGVRLSAKGFRTVVAYDPQLVTREETPDTLAALFRQRTRWNQGFLQVLRKGEWRRLATPTQRFFAWYTLAMPFLQGLTAILFPIAIATMLLLKAPILLALVTFAPLLLNLTMLACEAAALAEFCECYGQRARVGDYLRLVLGRFPYQVILGVAAARAVMREARGARNWEKTSHAGMHRPSQAPATMMRHLRDQATLAPQPVMATAAVKATSGPSASNWIAPASQLATAAPAGLMLSAVVDHGGAPSLRPSTAALSGRRADPSSRALSPARGWRVAGQRLAEAVGAGSRRWLAHWPDGLLVGLMLAVVGVAHVWGMGSAPGFDDDEGTYVAQAWAVQHWHVLAHYTYWYDHPPVGWLLTAAWTWLTRAFQRQPSSVTAGREVVALAHLASSWVLYGYARRLRIHRGWAATAVLLFSLSPLALHFHRMVFLDNLAVPFILAAFLLAATPGHRLVAYAASALCFALAVLVKETNLVLLVALAWQLWRSTDPRTRRISVALFAAVFILTATVYPLFATLKGELVPGPGHVSLLGAVKWQLFMRKSSGSVFDPARACPQSRGRGLRGLIGSGAWPEPIRN